MVAEADWLYILALVVLGALLPIFTEHKILIVTNWVMPLYWIRFDGLIFYYVTHSRYSLDR